MYGITETCVHVSLRPLTAADADKAASVIGTALPGLRIHLLDNQLRPVPTGVVGEIYVSGGQIAREYLGQRGRTAGRFVANPFDAPGDRLYRSGDTAMWTEEGELVYLGRTDEQVKVRGFRIELGEVESALAAHPDVHNAAATVWSDETGHRRLVGYLVGAGDLDTAAVRAVVAQRVPEYMVPSAFVVLDALPLTVNGKLDRAALPAPVPTETADAGEPEPAIGTATLLSRLCGEILGSPVALDDDFFAIGGDSILAIQLVNRARRAGVRISPQQVFTARTPAGLAALTGPGTPATGTEDSGPDLGEVMLTPIVHRLAELGGSISRLNQCELLCVPAGASEKRLQIALDALGTRHDALRLRLHRPTPMLWSLEVTEHCTLTLSRVDAAGLDDDALRQVIGAESDAAADRLDPDEGVVAQAVWFDRGSGQSGRLLLMLHHLAVDGVSWSVLVDDLRSAYEQSPLAPVATSIRAHARLVNENAQGSARLAEFPHWSEVLAPGADLDPTTPTVGLTVGATRDHEVRLTAQQTAALLTDVPALANADITETLLTALYLAVRRWRAAHGGEPHAPLLVDLERHGRDHWPAEVDLSRTVGWFTTITPVRLHSEHDEPISALKQVKESVRTAPDGGHGYGQLRYCNARTAAALGRFAAPQVLFNYLGRQARTGTTAWQVAPEADALRGAPDSDLGTPYLLEVNAFCEEGADGPRLRVILTYPDTEPGAASAEELGGYLAEVLVDLGRTADTAPARPALTPSDLALVTLRQSEIDTLLAAAPGPVDTIWPLSPLQEGVYFQARYSPAAVYIVQNVFDVAEPIDVAALCTAYSAVMRRHPVLRSGFHAGDLASPVAVIAADPVCEPEVIELVEQDRSRLDEITAAERLQTFDLARPPLARFTVVRAPEADRLIFSYHFLLLDGWSREQLLRDLFAEYAAARSGHLADLPVPTADFTDYLRWLQDQDRQASAQRWSRALSGLAAPTLLVPSAVGSEPVLALRLEVTLTEEQTTALTDTARHCGVTLNAVIGCALALVLGYETGSDDVVFGSTVAGRPTDIDGMDAVIGLFLNTVPTRVRLEPGRSLTAALRAIQNERLDLMDHEYLGLGEIQRTAGLPGALFDSLYVLQNFLGDDTFTDMENEHGIVGHDSVDASHYPLTWVASPGRRLWIKLEYRPDVVERDHAQRLLDRLQQVLVAMPDHRDQALSRLPLRLLHEADGAAAQHVSTIHPLPPSTVTDLLAEHRQATGAALVCGTDRIGYPELDDRITRLAWFLHNQGIGPESIVALAIPRSIDAVVALFAVLRAGAAYLPLELDYPDERLTVMLADACPALVLTAPTVADRIGALSPDIPTIVLGDNDLPAAPPAWTGVPVRLDDPAYLIYTSGSTGTPKGVLTAHRGLTNMHLNHREAIFGPAIATAGGRRMRIAHTVSFAFDMSWEELLWLIEGHEVHICDEHLRRDATALVAYCHENAIDVVNVTPTYAGLLFEEGLLDPAGHPPVLVLLGGEAVSPAVWNRLRDSDTSYGYNLYGPTEYTINTLGAGTDDSATPTVGRPIWNTEAHVLDAWLRPVPDGTPGELYIAGAGLSRGYVGQPGLSAARFVANPFGAGRMYRTGDVMVRRQDGNLDFLGRTDDQVKIRGYRVEPGDVQAALAAHPRVRHAAVIARPDPGLTGSDQLIGYIVAADDDPNVVADVRSALRTSLPAYMVPAVISVIDALPLTDNGKLDLRALPDVSVTGGVASRPPRTPAEAALCAVFGDILGIDEVGADDDFFALGGHSLLSIRLINRVRTEFGVTISLRDVFDAPTVAGLAALITGTGGHAHRPELAAGERPRRVPASPAQQRLLVLDRLATTGTAYNYPLVFRLHGRLDVTALHAAAGDVVDRHEVLRTVFESTESGFYQRILPPGTPPPLQVIDCRPDELTARIATAVDYRFDLSNEIPLRLSVLRAADDEYIVVVLLHHICTDEWSDGPFLDDLNRAYRGRVAGDRSGLPPLPVQYADFTLWQQRVLDQVGERQAEFWRRTLAGAPDEMTLPTDRARPARPSGRGGTVEVELAAELVAALRQLAGARRVSMLMLAHTAVAVLLHRLGAGEDIVLGTPVAGRDEAALSDLIGFFVNTVVLRTDVSGNPGFDDLLARVRDTDLAAFAHQELPFDQVVENLNPPRVLGRNPLFTVFLGYHLRDGEPTGMFGLPTTWQESATTAAMFDLGFTLVEYHSGTATLVTEYSADLFDESSVRTLADRLVRVMDQMVADPHRRIGSIHLLDEAERHTVVDVVNDTDHPSAPATLASLVTGQAGLTPTAVAVRSQDAELTYRELDDWSDRLTAGLLARGAGPGTVVAVSLPRSVELVVALVAVAKSGAAFLPLDTDYPADRLAYMIDDAAPAVILDDMAEIRRHRTTEDHCGADPDSHRRMGVRALHLRINGTAEGCRRAACRHRQPDQVAAARLPAGAAGPDAGEDPDQLRHFGMGGVLATERGRDAGHGPPGRSPRSALSRRHDCRAIGHGRGLRSVHARTVPRRTGRGQVHRADPGDGGW